MLLVIDNYDSFTYNLVQYFGQLGVAQRVFRNDEITPAEAVALKPDRVLISPGPCSPVEAGVSLDMIETFAGRIRLGDYETISSPVFFLSKKIKYVLLTDIDDTIKESNIAETTTWKQIVRALFRGNYYTYRAIDGMAELYRQMAAQGALIVYVTSTPFQLAPFLMKFLREREFPEGPVYLRWLGYNRYGHKWRILHRILSNAEDQRFVLIGDSGEQDLAIYRRIADNPAFGRKIEKVLIRHVPGTPWQKTLHAREGLYKNIDELREILSFMLPTP